MRRFASSRNRMMGFVGLLLLLVHIAPATAHGRRPPREPADQFVALVQRADALYRDGQYQESIEQLERAWAVRPLPRLLFNIGQAHRRLEHPREALDYYQRFLDAEPKAPPALVEEVKQRIEEMRAKIPPPPPPETPVTVAQTGPASSPDSPGPAPQVKPAATPAPPPPPPVPLYKRWWLWTGAAVVVVGGVTVGLVAAKYRDPAIGSAEYGPFQLP